MMKNNFTGSVISVCSGTGAFISLSENSFIRTVFHFLLLTLLMSCFSTAMRSMETMKLIDRYFSAFSGVFGGIVVKGNALLPVIDPEKTKTLIIGRTRIDYVPLAQDPGTFKMQDNVSLLGILWMPESLTLWARDSGKFRFQPLIEFPGYSSKAFSGTSEDLLGFGKESSLPEGLLKQFPEISFPQMKDSAIFAALLLIFLNFLLTTLFFISFFVFFASFFFSMTAGAGTVIKLDFRKLLVIGLYASFPAVIISALFYGLGLEFLDFKTVAMGCFIVYFTVVINKLQKKPSTETESFFDEL